MDLKLRFRRRQETQRELGAKYQWDLHIVHIASGRVCPAAIELAATYIVDGTHREATPAEVAAYQEDQRREGEHIAATDRRFSRINQQPEERDHNARRYQFQ
jgi:hypothetical protein